jgi:ribosomal subunit interface protein
MLYQITGKQIDIGEALQTHAKSVVDAVAAKYAERPTDAPITFSRSANKFVCEVSVHLSTGITAQANAHDHDHDHDHDHEIYTSFDAASEKMEKQLRRYKRRLKDHHRDRTHPVELSGASSYVLSNHDESNDSKPETLQPLIVAEMEQKNNLCLLVRQ